MSNKGIGVTSGTSALNLDYNQLIDEFELGYEKLLNKVHNLRMKGYTDLKSMRTIGILKK